MGPERAASDFPTVEFDSAASILGKYDCATRLCRPAWNALDGSDALCAAATEFGRIGFEEYLSCRQPSTAERDFANFGDGIQRKHAIRRTAGRDSEANVKRTAISGCVHLLEVHDELERILRIMGRGDCSDISVLPERLQPEGGMGTVLLRYGACGERVFGIRDTGRPREEVRQRHESSAERDCRRMVGKSDRLLAHGICVDDERREQSASTQYCWFTRRAAGLHRWTEVPAWRCRRSHHHWKRSLVVRQELLSSGCAVAIWNLRRGNRTRT